VALADENTAEQLRRLILPGAEASDEGAGEDARKEALGRLRERAKEARQIFGEDTEVSVRKVTTPAYNPKSRREHIVGQIPLREGELGPTTEDYVQDLLREAAGQTVYLESIPG